MTRALFLRMPLTPKLATESVYEVVGSDDLKMTGCKSCTMLTMLVSMIGRQLTAIG